MKNYSGSFIAPIVVSAVFALVTIALMIWGIYGALGADADKPCLSKAQAQAKWPGQWLYWHTEQKCWDNLSVRSHRATYQKKNSLQLGKPLLDPSGNLFRHSGRPVEIVKGPSVFYPDLMPGPGTDGSMLRPDGMTWWPVLIDVDEQPQFVPWQKRISFLTKQEKP
jgi:hypothetical protein